MRQNELNWRMRWLANAFYRFFLVFGAGGGVCTLFFKVQSCGPERPFFASIDGMWLYRKSPLEAEVSGLPGVWSLGTIQRLYCHMFFMDRCGFFAEVYGFLSTTVRF